jgi:hypothetical protein
LPKFGWFNPIEPNKRNSSGVEYVTLQINIGWRKVKTCESLDQQNGFWRSRYAQFAEVGKGAAKAITPACCWLARSFDWSRWVAISNLPPILVLWVGLAKE